MPTYKVHLNHVYEDDEWVEVEANDEHAAYDIAETASNINHAYDHAMHTSTTVLDIEKIED